MREMFGAGSGLPPRASRRTRGLGSASRALELKSCLLEASEFEGHHAADDAAYVGAGVEAVVLRLLGAGRHSVKAGVGQITEKQGSVPARYRRVLQFLVSL